MQKAIAIDFDGTLCTNDYPNIGEPNWEIIAEAKMEQAHGAGLILWTCREGEMLDAADESEAAAVMEIGEEGLEKLAKSVGVDREPGESWRRLRRRTVEQMVNLMN